MTSKLRDARKSVFWAVPAGETQCLEIMFGGETDDEDFGGDFLARLVEQASSAPRRWLMFEESLDLTQVNRGKRGGPAAPIEPPPRHAPRRCWRAARRAVFERDGYPVRHVRPIRSA